MISVVIPVVEIDVRFWEKMVSLVSHLARIDQGPFEILVIPNGPAGKPDCSPPKELRVQIADRIPQAGKGRAVREGFRLASGNPIFMIDADLPYDLSFIETALELLNRENDLVYANRRHANSYFRVKVPTLHLAFRRHCIGLVFNFFVRTFLKIRSRDTQAGIKALSQRLAKSVVERGICPGFLFDLEIFLITKLSGWRMSDLPVVFNLDSEKTSVRLVREMLAILAWLPRIRWNLALGTYQPQFTRTFAPDPV